MYRQPIGCERELGVDDLDVANEYSRSTLGVELRLLRSRNLSRAFRTPIAISEQIVRLRSRR